MVPQRRMQEFVSVASAAYNTASSHIVAGIADAVHIWNMRTGSYLKKFSGLDPSNADVVLTPTPTHP